ncbi:M48 family metallopeptidase [Pseudoxanthomonas sp. PXM02]|uniref:M48 family metallopeptidase n=1 Tax=Pseudoxanthomonas sp. PXM02 TaxID=2769294 RepID=UPI00177B2538|nr:M48 family metallopeptidase [Pseudoxanthomonas sp. PXM02]MBD9480692.1 M48 family metalloprotease [Pseudoxanthomonas sp. PXM02]
MLGLSGFMLAYLGLMTWFGWTAYRLVAKLLAGSGAGDSAFITLLVAGCTAFLAVFMAKALIFRRKTEVSSADIEITAAQHPELFAFLHRLADEARAPRPYRVFLSPRVNASVFYDLTLLNLLLPSRKNLEIGLALVNVLSLGELKAVLAHEFGHFAQRSMAVGRWVYVAQQIAAHIVAKRDALDTVLATLSRLDLRIAWIGWALSLVVWSIRSLVEIVFRWVLIAQRALSREMEFQADLVAASLTGSDALVHALHKLGAADEAWERALQFASREAARGHAVKDVFAIQSRIIERLRDVLDDPAYGAAPAAGHGDASGHRVFAAELAPPPQMWSTHPSNNAREHNVKKVYVACGIDTRPAIELLRDAQGLKETLSSRLLPQVPETFAEPSVSLGHLDEEYEAIAMSRRYRGAYLGRSFVRRCQKAHELYEAVPADADLLARIDALYSPQVGNEIEQLRELEQQRAMLDAIRIGAMETEGGMVNWRGSQVPRKNVPRILAELDAEISPLRTAVEAHDRQCRSLHCAAAERLGGRWAEALRGQLDVLHYAEHARADLDDAHAVFVNTFHVVTADNRVSETELRRLVAACNQVHSALDTIYAKAPQVMLDDAMATGLGVTEWSAALHQPFELPRASEQNINQWMKVVQGWVDATQGALGGLRHVALEALLTTEDRVADQLRTTVALPPPVTVAAAPREYPLLVPGKGRTLQHRLGWWDRFQTATGVVPAATRLVVAGGIVGSVFLLGGAVGHSTLTVYNGLARDMRVEVAGQTVDVPAFSHKELTLPEQSRYSVQTHTGDSGELVERFDEQAPAGSEHLVYSIAGAAPLVEWTASYGSAGERPERRLGAVRWTSTKVDHLFSDPPEQISSRSGSGWRTVLSGFGDAAPGDILGLLPEGPEQAKVVDAHARWDAVTSPHTREWWGRASERGELQDLIELRLKHEPRAVGLLRMEQDLTEGEAHAAVCTRHRALAQAQAGEPSLQYIAARCTEDERARDQAFLDGHARWPKDAWFAMAAGYVHAERQQWQPAMELLQQGSRLPEIGDYVGLDVARVQRVVGDGAVPAKSVAASSRLRQMMALESGEQTGDSPMHAYHLMAAGQLDQATTRAVAAEADTGPRILRLLGASDGADAATVKLALSLPAGSGIDPDTVWPSLALALREHQPAAALRQAALDSDPDDAPDILRFIDAVQGGASIAQAESTLGAVAPRSRGLAYSAAVVLKGRQCPEAWRQAAKRLLFAPERPYFG